MIEHLVLAASLAFNGWILYKFIRGHKLVSPIQSRNVITKP